jgi:hypothetical protein
MEVFSGEEKHIDSIWTNTLPSCNLNKEDEVQATFHSWNHRRSPDLTATKQPL